MPTELLRLLIAPLLLLAVAGLVYGHMLTLPPEVQLLVVYLPYLLGTTNVLLGFMFNQSRLLLATLNLLGGYTLFEACLQPSVDRPDNFVLFSLLSLLLPAGQLLVGLTSERGLRNRRALLRRLLPLLGYPLLWQLWHSHVLGRHLDNMPMLMLQLVVDGRYLSQGAAWLSGITLLIGALALYWRRGRDDAALFGILLTLPLLLYGLDQPRLSALLFTVMQLMLSHALISHSHRLAFIDELTGIPARRALKEQLTSLGRRYTIAMMDIDHFKQFNDRYGHDAGDQVLRMVASQLRRVGGGGRVFRYGGEEFTVLFRGKSEADALPHLEQLRESIAEYPLQIRQPDRPRNDESGRQMRRAQGPDRKVRVTISIGLCEHSQAFPGSNEVMQQADKALYAAKRAGRNRTVPSHRLRQRRRHGQADFA